MTSLGDSSSHATFKVPLDVAFVVLAVLVLSSNVLEVVVRDTLPGGGPIATLTYLALYGIAVLFCLLARVAPDALWRSPLLAVALALPLLSVAWSISPFVTLERAVGVIGTSAVGLFVGWRYGVHRMIRLCAYGFAANMLLSALVIVLVPSIGIDQSANWGGTWIGVHFHKNGFGGMLTLAVPVTFYAWLISSGRERLVFGALLALSLVLLLGSRSATSQLIVLAALALAGGLLLRRSLPGLPTLLGLIGLVVTPVAVALALQLDLWAAFLEALGKNATLSGRLPIWQAVWPYLEQRWWLGYGWGAFWQPDMPWIDAIEARLYFTPFYSHNGVVETWLGLGVVGVAASLALFAWTGVKAAVVAARDAGPAGGFALVIVLVFALRNITEASILTRNDIVWTLFVAVSAALARDVVLRFGRADPAPEAAVAPRNRPARRRRARHNPTFPPEAARP